MLETAMFARPTIVEIWAPSCAACSAMRPALEEVADEHAGTVALVTVDASSEPGTARSLGAVATPTLIGFRDGREVFRRTGRRTPAELRALFFDVSTGEASATVGLQDMVLRIGAGAALSAVGLAAGPVWPLVAGGAVVIGYGLVPWVRRRQ